MTFSKHSLIALALASAFISGCQERKDGGAEIVDARAVSPYHQVKKGETLDTIAKKYGITKSDLIILNDLKAPYTLYPKQRIKIKTIEAANDNYYASDSDLVVKNIDEPKPEQKDESKNDLPAISIEQNEAGFIDHKAPTEAHAEQTTPLPIESAKKPVASNHTYDWPVKGKVIRNFGEKSTDGTTQCMSIKAPVGTKVKAVADGEVLRAGKVRELREWGNIAMIKQHDGRVSVYGFLKDVYVKKGQAISQGKVIGTVGKNKNEPMLVFHIREKVAGKLIPVDPMKYLN